MSVLLQKERGDSEASMPIEAFIDRSSNDGRSLCGGCCEGGEWLGDDDDGEKGLVLAEGSLGDVSPGDRKTFIVRAFAMVPADQRD